MLTDLPPNEPTQFTEHDRNILLGCIVKLEKYERFIADVTPLIKELGEKLDGSPVMRMLGFGKK